jgi:hypothetical protein
MKVIKTASPTSMNITLEIIPEDNLSGAIFQSVVEKTSDLIADACLQKYGTEILASIDKETIKDMCKVRVAQRVYKEMADMNERAAPFSRCIPKFNESQKKKINSILSD